MCVGRKETLTAFSRHIETLTSHTADPPMVLSALQQPGISTSATRRRYLELARTAPLVALFGEHPPTDLGPGIRGVALDPDDPLRPEMDRVAVGRAHRCRAHRSERPDDPTHHHPDQDRRFDFTITYDRSLITAAAHHLLDRML
jgi:DICT domain-containing protein